MTAAEFDAFLAETRAYVAAQLAAIDAVDPAALTELERADLEQLRASYLELQATLTDEVIAAELAATEYAGRDLTPAEVAAIRRRQ